MSVESGRHTGWNWDAPNSYLEVFVRGTRVAYFDDTGSDLTLLINGLSVDSGGLTVTAGGVTVGGGVAVTGNSTFADDITYSNAWYASNSTKETIVADKTLDAEDTGKIFLCATDSTQFTLPATEAGLTYTIINTQASDSSAEIAFSPHSDDKIMGPDIAGVDDKDLINTAASSKSGDMCRIVGDGSLGWYVTEVTGTWAAQG